MNLSRRGLIGSLMGAVICAPAIVRASSLMPIKAYPATLDIDRIAAAINARLDAYPLSEWRWRPEEVEQHKLAGGWPEYGDGGARMRGPRLTREQLRSENI